ncbi:MAG: hypothetical protein JNL10_05355 [Verrucomicrobiales bacterium]|nr:hypothetical protein [Verrucomicrobiales bacterium]
MKLNRMYERGDVVEVMPTPATGALPSGLGAGFQVRVVQLDASGDLVEREGREWRIPCHQLRPRCRGRRL